MHVADTSHTVNCEAAYLQQMATIKLWKTTHALTRRTVNSREKTPSFEMRNNSLNIYLPWVGGRVVRDSVKQKAKQLQIHFSNALKFQVSLTQIKKGKMLNPQAMFVGNSLERVHKDYFMGK